MHKGRNKTAPVPVEVILAQLKIVCIHCMTIPSDGGFSPPHTGKLAGRVTTMSIGSRIDIMMILIFCFYVEDRRLIKPMYSFTRGQQALRTPVARKRSFAVLVTVRWGIARYPHSRYWR